MERVAEARGIVEFVKQLKRFPEHTLFVTEVGAPLQGVIIAHFCDHKKPNAYLVNVYDDRRIEDGPPMVPPDDQIETHSIEALLLTLGAQGVTADAIFLRMETVEMPHGPNIHRN